MFKTIAKILLVVILSCEWHDTLGNVFSCENSCKTSCGKSNTCNSEKPVKKNCNDESNKCNLKQNCCNCCCYVLPGSYLLQIFQVPEMKYAEVKINSVSGFSNDCFRPPEVA